MADARLKNVRKSFGPLQILKGIDLTIEAHNFTVLLGPSGCGKSTTLRILAGLEKQTAGEIWIGDHNVSDLEPRDRDVAMVFQNYALYPTMTIAQNIGFGLKARRMPKAEIHRHVAQAARMLGIADLLNRKPGQLSGGQQQRVAIGRAIVRNPNLFLFDEPLSNLDAKLRVEMRTELLRLQRELGATTIYVTHDQEEAMTMADRIVIMNDGRIEQIGTPAEIYFKPVSLMVADFVGSPVMNFLQGHRTGSVLETPFGFLRLEDHPSCGTAITVGVRPDDLYFPDELAESDKAYTVEFTVEFIELLGARGIVTLRRGDIAFKGVFEERFLSRFERGGAVTLVLNSKRLHLFDTTSGVRLPIMVS